MNMAMVHPNLLFPDHLGKPVDLVQSGSHEANGEAIGDGTVCGCRSADRA